MDRELGRYFWGTIVIVIALALISSMIAMFSMVEFLASFRIVFGSVYVLFLPGFVISYIFFSKTHKHGEKKYSTKGSIDWIERIALSFGLSIAIVPLMVFYLNLIGVGINLLNSFLTILGILFISTGILMYKKKRRK